MTTNLPALRALYYAEPAVNALIDEVERLRKEAVENGWPEASRQLARALTAEKRLAEAEKVIGAMEGWVTAALDCEAWIWDSDQKEIATRERDQARAFMKGGQP